LEEQGQKEATRKRIERGWHVFLEIMPGPKA